jgi:4-carboxymuconolactone decarboxylase
VAHVRTETADTLRGLTVGEPSVVEGLLGKQHENLEDSGLDPRAYALVRIAALIALGAPPATFTAQVAFALDSEVTAEEVLGVLVAVGPHVGMPRVIGAAPELMLALGLPVHEA